MSRIASANRGTEATLLEAACHYPEVYLTCEDGDWCAVIVNPLSGRKYALFTIGDNTSYEDLCKDFASLVTHTNKGNRLIFKANGVLAIEDK